MKVGLFRTSHLPFRAILCLGMTGCVHHVNQDGSFGPTASSQTVPQKSLFGFSLRSKHASILADPSDWPQPPDQTQHESRFHELFPNLSHRLQHRKSVVLGQPQPIYPAEQSLVPATISEQSSPVEFQPVTADVDASGSEQAPLSETVSESPLINESQNTQTVPRAKPVPFSEPSRSTAPVQTLSKDQSKASETQPVTEGKVEETPAGQPSAAPLKKSEDSVPAKAETQAETQIDPARKSAETKSPAAKPAVSEKPETKSETKSSASSEPLQPELAKEPEILSEQAKVPTAPVKPTDPEPKSSNRPMETPPKAITPEPASVPVKPEEKSSKTLDENVEPKAMAETPNLGIIPGIPASAKPVLSEKNDPAIGDLPGIPEQPSVTSSQPAHVENAEAKLPTELPSENVAKVQTDSQRATISHETFPSNAADMPPAIPAEEIVVNPMNTRSEAIQDQQPQVHLETNSDPAPLQVTEMEIPAIPDQNPVETSQSVPPSLKDVPGIPQEDRSQPEHIALKQPSDISHTQETPSQTIQNLSPVNQTVISSQSESDTKLPEEGHVTNAPPQMPLISSDRAQASGISPIVPGVPELSSESSDIPPPVPAPEIDSPGIPQMEVPGIPQIAPAPPSLIRDSDETNRNDSQIERSSSPDFIEIPKEVPASVQVRSDLDPDDKSGPETSESEISSSTAVPDIDRPIKVLEPLPEELLDNQTQMIQKTAEGDFIVRLHVPNPLKNFNMSISRPSLLSHLKPDFSRFWSPLNIENRNSSGLSALKNASASLFQRTESRTQPVQPPELVERNQKSYDSMTEVSQSPQLKGTNTEPVVNQGESVPALGAVLADSEIHKTGNLRRNFSEPKSGEPASVRLTTSQDLPQIEFPTSYSNSKVRRSANPWADHKQPAVNPYIMNSRLADSKPVTNPTSPKQNPVKPLSVPASQDENIVRTSLTLQKQTESSSITNYPTASESRGWFSVKPSQIFQTGRTGLWSKTSQSIRSLLSGDEEVVPARPRPINTQTQGLIPSVDQPGSASTFPSLSPIRGPGY